MRHSESSSEQPSLGRSFCPQFTLRALLATVLVISLLLGVARPWIQMALRSHTGRLWRPSSDHSGIVNNCYGHDGLDDGIDPQVYLWILTRNNGEPLAATNDPSAANK